MSSIKYPLLIRQKTPDIGWFQLPFQLSVQFCYKCINPSHMQCLGTLNISFMLVFLFPECPPLPPTKSCKHCGRMSHIACRKCPHCGESFGAGRKRFQVEPYSKPPKATSDLLQRLYFKVIKCYSNAPLHRQCSFLCTMYMEYCFVVRNGIERSIYVCGTKVIYRFYGLTYRTK